MSKRDLTILVVDDDEADVAMMQRYLSKSDAFSAQFAIANDAESARLTLAQQRIDVVLLDFRLGADSGLELLKMIRAAGATAPVIFLTGFGSEQLAAQVAREGANAYLSKDDLTEELLQATVSDVVTRCEAEQEQIGFDQALSRMATEDQVTGLLKRHAFQELLAQECARTERYERPLALLVLDLDGFQRVNEAKGRAAGDQILANTAVVMRGLMRTTDHFCRYEGDRFCVALTETNEALARNCAARLLDYVARTAFTVDGSAGISLTCSIGLTIIKPTDANAEGAIVDAMAALAEAKKAGGNRVVTTGG